MAFYIANPRCANLSDPGTGKTPSVCVYTQYLWEKKGSKVIWVMPTSLFQKNVDELLVWTRFERDEIAVMTGSRQQKLDMMQDPNVKIFIMSGDHLRDWWRSLIKEWQPEIDAVLVDEAHMIYKSVSSGRTEALFRTMRHCKHFLPMTGSLIDGRLDSAYPVINIIEPRYYMNIWAFRNQHGLYDEWGTLVGWTNHEKLGRIFKRHAIRRSFQSIFGDQEIVYIRRQCEMSPKQREAYDEFEASAMLELEDEFLDGGLPGVHTIRCRQIMAHPETFGLAKGERTGKDEQLVVELEDHLQTGKPAVIYATFHPEQERIVELCKNLGFRVGLINGNVPSTKRSKIDEAFRNGELDIIVASPETASVGFNWGHVDHFIFASIDYRDVNFLQAVRRGIRGNRETPLRVTILEYKKSVDQRIFFIVTNKNKHARLVDDTTAEVDLVRTPDRQQSGIEEMAAGNNFNLDGF